MIHRVRAEDRVLLVAPVGGDGPITVDLLERAGFQVELCPDLEDLCRRIPQGVGAVLLTSEALTPVGFRALMQHLADEPPWSTLPLLVATDSRPVGGWTLNALQTLEQRRGVTFLERPLRIMTLVSSLQAALESRRRQYEIRRLLHHSQEGIRYRDEFLAMLGHELRNPLAPLRNVVDVLRMVGGNDPQRLTWGLDVLDRQVAHLSHLVDDLLDVARVSRGHIQVRRERVDLVELVRAAAEEVRPLLEQRRQQLHLDLPDRPVPVRGDTTRLVQVLSNLLDNAAKYTNADGRVELSLRVADQQASLRVRDNGMGIPPEVLPQVFDLFAQAKQNLARSRGGLGLGLTLVRRLVEMHNGTVQAHSEGPGRGAEFRVSLPVLEAPDDPPEAEPPQWPDPAADARVVVVDDNADVAHSTALLLQALGYDTRTALNGHQALDLIDRFRPVAALLDIGLPDLDGYQLAQRLRRRYGNRLRLVALTGYGGAEDIRQARAAGFDRHLTKPAMLDDLRNALSPDAAEQ